MSYEYATVHIPKSLPIHGMALTSTGRKIEHNKVMVDSTNAYELNVWVALETPGLSCIHGVVDLL